MTVVWTSPAALDAMRDAANERGVTEEMAKAAHAVLADYFDVTFRVRVAAFLDGVKDSERASAIADLQAADERAWVETMAVVAAAVAAALAAKG